MVSKTGWMRLILAGTGLIGALVLLACSDDDDEGGANGVTGATTPVNGEATATPASGGGPTGLSGTGAGGVSVTPPAPPSFPATDEPPAASASANSESVETGIGTYCWTRLCVDKIGVPTKGTLIVSPGDTVSVAIPEGVPALREAGANVFEAVGALPLDDGSEIWPYPGATGAEVDYEVTNESVDVVIDLPPGRYVLSVFMSFESGDVVYGVLVEVQ